MGKSENIFLKPKPKKMGARNWGTFLRATQLYNNNNVYTQSDLEEILGTPSSSSFKHRSPKILGEMRGKWHRKP